MQLIRTPRFSTTEIINNTLRKDWFLLQNYAFELGKTAHSYMQGFINSHKKRRGGQGKLSRSIKFYSQTGAGYVSWGIGLISELSAYWYVINYGKMITGEPFVPARGGFVPGSFEGSRPEAGLAGGVEKFNYKDGSNFGMYPKRPVRPMNYIEATKARLNANLRVLMLRLKRGA